MISQEARKLADGYVERQRKHDNSFLVRIKKYFKKRKEEKRFKRYFKIKFLNSIYNKALQGEYSTQITIYLDYGCNTEFDDEAIRKLKEMGYEVTFEDITNDIMHINISWDNKED